MWQDLVHEKQSLRSYGNHTSAIVAIISQPSLKSGFRMIATIAKHFHGSARSDRSDNTETSL